MDRGRKIVFVGVSYKYWPANSLIKIAEKQFFVNWGEFYILDSIFLKVYRVFLN